MKRLKYLLLIMLLIPITVNATLNKITIEPDEIKIPGRVISYFTVDNYEQVEKEPNYFYKLDENGNMINKVTFKENDQIEQFRGFKDNKYKNFTMVISQNNNDSIVKLYDENNILIAEKTFANVTSIHGSDYFEGFFILEETTKDYSKIFYVIDEKLNIIRKINTDDYEGYLTPVAANKDYLILKQYRDYLLSINLNTGEVIQRNKNPKIKNLNIRKTNTSSEIIALIENDEIKFLNNKLEEVKVMKKPGGYVFNNLIKTDSNEYILIFTDVNIDDNFYLTSYEEFKKNIITIKYDKNFNEISRPSIEDVVYETPEFNYIKEYYNINTLKEFYDARSKLAFTYYRRFGKKFESSQANLDAVIYKDEIFMIHGLEGDREEAFGDLYITQASLDLKEIKTHFLMTITVDEGYHPIKFIPGENDLKIAVENYDLKDHDYYIRIKTIKTEADEYNIASMPNNNGYIEHPDKASPGTEVTFKPIPNEGYVLSGLYLIDELGNKEHIKGNTFIMPEHNVTIEAIYTIENPNTSTINFISMLILIPIIPITIYLINKYSQNKIYN